MIEGIVFDLKFERDRRCYRLAASRPTIRSAPSRA